MQIDESSRSVKTRLSEHQSFLRIENQIDFDKKKTEKVTKGTAPTSIWTGTPKIDWSFPTFHIGMRS